MKKTLFLIFALLITIWCPLSSETSAEDILHISAFKPYKNGVYLHVNNALSHDDVIIEDEIIELNDILDRLMLDNGLNTCTELFESDYTKVYCLEQ